MKRLARSAGRRASGVLAWPWCFGAILFPTAILQAAEEMATLCSSTCQLHSVVIPDYSAAAGNAVYPRCPFDLDVGDGLLGGGMQVVQALGAAALHLFDEDTAVGETDDAELADQVGRHRTVHIVVENVPAVEERPQTVAADFDRDRVLGGVGRAAHFVEIWLRHVVKMRRRAGPDIADHLDLGRRWRLVCARWERLGAGQQPFRRNPEAPRIFFRILRAIVSAAGILRSLVRAVGRHRNAHRLAGKARRLEALLARHA